MSKSVSSPRDLEMLSAYLDGQLSQQEVARLRVRMRENPRMQIALDELRMTRAALRSLPKLRAPRKFTLTPQMVNVRGATRRRVGTTPYPAFGLASIVASLLLVFVFVADRLSFVNTSQSTALEAAVQATQMEEMVQTIVVESLATQAGIVPEAETMDSVAKVGEESSRIAEPTEASAEALTLAYPAPTLSALSEAAPEEAPPPAPNTQEAGSITLAMTGTLTETATPSLPLTLTAAPGWGIGGGAPEFTITPEISAALAISSPTSTTTPEPVSLPTDTAMPPEEPLQLKQVPAEIPSASTADQPKPETRPNRSIFLVAEIVLAFLAAISALISIYLYRKAG